MKKIKKLFAKKWTKIILIILVLAIAATTVFVLKFKKPTVTTTQSYVRTTTLSYGNLDNTVVASGTISSQNSSSITSSAQNAQVKKINVSVGDYVKEGDVIIELDTENIQKQIDRLQEQLDDQKEALQEKYNTAYDELDEAEDAYDEAKAARNTARDDYESVYNTYVKSYETTYNNSKATTDAAFNNILGLGLTGDETQDKLLVGEWTDQTQKDEYATYSGEDLTGGYLKVYKDAKSISDADLKDLEAIKKSTGADDLYKTYTTAQAKKESTEATLKIKEEAFEKAEEALNDGVNTDTLDDYKDQLSDYKLKAKSSGQITALNATVGQIASGTLATIQDTDNLTITVSIDEYDISSIELGMSAKITTDAVDGEFDGKVVTISPVSSAATGGGMMQATSSSSSFDVEINVTSNSKGLLIGMSCEVTIYLSTIENVFTVPKSAIETVDGTNYVYVRNSDGEFVQTEVTVGESSGYFTEISGDNIKAGDVVRSSYNEDEATVEADASDMMGAMNFGGGNMPQGNFSSGDRPSGMPSGGPSGFGG